MRTTLDKLVVEKIEFLVDQIVKDAIRQIPAYSEAPLHQTIERVETWLRMLASSIQENDPRILERYLAIVAQERHQELYDIAELHTIIQITDLHVRSIIEGTVADQVERNALTSLLEAVLGAARMVLSVSYVLIHMGKTSGSQLLGETSH